MVEIIPAELTQKHIDDAKQSVLNLTEEQRRTKYDVTTECVLARAVQDALNRPKQAIGWMAFDDSDSHYDFSDEVKDFARAFDDWSQPVIYNEQPFPDIIKPTKFTITKTPRK